MDRVFGVTSIVIHIKIVFFDVDDGHMHRRWAIPMLATLPGYKKHAHASVLFI